MRERVIPSACSPTEAEKQSSGVTGDLVRLSVGIEDPGRIIEDLRQAIEAAN